MKKTLAAVALVAAPLMAAQPALAAGNGDASTQITSKVPVPGGFTAGSWAVTNSSADSLPAGTTFLVTFDDLKGGAAKGSMTVTSRDTNGATVLKLTNNTFRVTLNTTFNAGTAFLGYWSDSHGFNFGGRDKVTISLESAGNGTDSNPANNVSVYDNGGHGF